MRSLLFLFFLFVLLTPATAQVLQTDLALNYLVQLPRKKTDKPPVLILLHGYGSNEADLFSLSHVFPDQFLIIAPRAPLPLGKDAWQWYRMTETNGQADAIADDVKNSSVKIKNLITEVVRKYHADPSSVYLAGFSQGAVMSYETGLTTAGLIKGIGAWSGKLLPALRLRLQSARKTPQLRIFIGHGTSDNRIPYSEAVAADKFLKAQQLSPAFHTYNGMAHQINDAELKDFLQWLEVK